MLAYYLVQQVAADIISILLSIQIVHFFRSSFVNYFDPFRLQCLQRLKNIGEIEVQVLRLTSADDVSQILPHLKINVQQVIQVTRAETGSIQDGRMQWQIHLYSIIGTVTDDKT